MQSFNSASAFLLQRTFTFRCLSDSCCTKESSDQYSWNIVGSLILISVFLLVRDVGREAFPTNSYTDVLLALN